MEYQIKYKLDEYLNDYVLALKQAEQMILNKGVIK